MGEIASIQAARRRRGTEHVEIRSDMEKRLAEARLKLVETGTRNRLVHSPRHGRRSRVLQIVGAEPDCAFTSLAREGRTLRFLSADEATEMSQDNPRGKVHKLDTRRHGREIRAALPTTLSADQLQKRLHVIQRDGKVAEEERGMSILFLAIGFLRWYEDERSDIPRHAPLVLVPVSLVRDPRRSTYDLRFRDEEITTNQALQERLRNDFALSFPTIPETEDWTPSSYFEAVGEAVRSKRRWAIEADEIELGFYSFSKVLMMRDLEPGSWPGSSLLSHPLLRGLLCDGFGGEPPIFSETTNLDEVLAPADLVQVVDADSSQTKVIETVRAGRNLVVQGPPGTGKSQTITNLVASAVHDGKTVLFVAEKKAALDIVHARLCDVGLEDICLELHGQAVSKRLVADRLDRTLQASAPPVGTGTTESLTRVRDRLNATARRLHEVIGDSGTTPYQALATQIAMAAPQIMPDARLVAEAGTWSRADYELRLKLTETLATLASSTGPRDMHAYVGVRRIGLQPGDLHRHVQLFRALATDAAALAASATEVAIALGLDQPPTLSDVKRLVHLMRLFASVPEGSEPVAIACARAPSLHHVIDAATRAVRWQAHQAPLASMFLASAWTAPVARLRTPLASGATSWIVRRGKAYQDACRSLSELLAVPLPTRPTDRLAFLDALLENQALLRALGSDAALLASFLGPAWRGKETDFSRLSIVARAIEAIVEFDPRVDVVRAVASLRDGLAARYASGLDAALVDVSLQLGTVIHKLDLDLGAAFHIDSVTLLDLGALAERAELWAAESERFEQWARLVQADAALRAVGPLAIVDGLASGTLEPERAVAEIEAAYAEACWTKAIEADPDLAAFDGTRHEALVARFSALEAARREETVHLIRARHQEAIPSGALGAMGVIRGEIGRKRNHMPLRKLMAAGGRRSRRSSRCS